MKKYLATLLHVAHTDEEVILRARNLIKIALVLLSIALCFALIWLGQSNPLSGSAALIMAAAFGFAIWLARRGAMTFAATIVIGPFIIAILTIITVRQRMQDAPFFMLIPLSVAGAILTPRQIIVVGLIAFSSLFAAVLYIAEAVQVPITTLEASTGIDALVLVVLFSCLSFLTANGISNFLRRAAQAQQQALSLATSLEAMNERLESQVQERTTTLTLALAQQQHQAEELQHSLDRQQRLSATINALALPLIPVRDDVLVVPLIGALDQGRSNDLLQVVLQQIEQSRIRTLILDVTGAVAIDTSIAQAILQLASAAQLLGAETMLVGIRPEMAQTLVSLGVNLSHLHSAATLQKGLEQIMLR